MLITQAKEGNSQALEATVRYIQDRVYNLALRMLQDPKSCIKRLINFLLLCQGFSRLTNQLENPFFICANSRFYYSSSPYDLT